MLCVGLKNDRLLTDLADLSRVDLNGEHGGGYDLIYSEDVCQIPELMQKLNPGGVLAVEHGTQLKRGHGLQRVILVDAITRSVLAKDSLDIYRAPGAGGIRVNLRRFHEILKSVYRRR
jgi:hypothetical protein